MGRILVGIVKCGAWGCFDEFNRLEEIVLSAVSMQIQTIQAALKNQTHKALLLGSEVCNLLEIFLVCKIMPHNFKIKIAIFLNLDSN